jgi:hypothetical protein
LPCAECPKELLKEHLANPRWAGLLQRVSELEFAASAGFQLSLDDVTAEEFQVMAMLALERQEHERREALRQQHQKT